MHITRPVAADLLVIDEFGMKALDRQLPGLLEIIEDRHGRKVSIIVS